MQAACGFNAIGTPCRAHSPPQLGPERGDAYGRAFRSGGGDASAARPLRTVVRPTAGLSIPKLLDAATSDFLSF